MIWFWELSWLWKMLGVALLVSAVCVAAATLIGKAAKIRLGKKVFLLVGILAFVISILVIFFLVTHAAEIANRLFFSAAAEPLPFRLFASFRFLIPRLIQLSGEHLVNGPVPRSL